MGLEALIELGRKRICGQSDSQLLVRQLNGEYRVKDEKLKILYLRAHALLRHFDSYRIVHVYREMSKVPIDWPIAALTTRWEKQHGLKWIKRSRSRFGAGEESPDSTGQGGR